MLNFHLGAQLLVICSKRFFFLKFPRHFPFCPKSNNSFFQSDTYVASCRITKKNKMSILKKIRCLSWYIFGEKLNVWWHWSFLFPKQCFFEKVYTIFFKQLRRSVLQSYCIYLVCYVMIYQVENFENYSHRFKLRWEPIALLRNSRKLKKKFFLFFKAFLKKRNIYWRRSTHKKDFCAQNHLIENSWCEFFQIYNLF